MKHMRSTLFLVAAGFLFVPALASAQQGPPPQCSMTSNTGVVVKGGTVNLSWKSNNAVGGTITSIGGVGPSGTQGVIPTKTTEYVGVFTGAGGSVRCSVVIIVTLPTGGTTAPAASGPAGQTVGTGQSGTPNNPATPSSQTSAPGRLVPCTGLNCQACHLAELVQRVVNFTILLSIPLAAILIAVAGALIFMSGAVDKINQAKGILKAAIVGFLIAMTAWLVVNTVLYVLFDQKQFPNGSWFALQCVQDSQRPMNGSISALINNVLGVPQALPTVITTSNTNAGVSYGEPGCYDGSTLLSGKCVSASGDVNEPVRCPTGSALVGSECIDAFGNSSTPVTNSTVGTGGGSTNGLVSISSFGCKNPQSCAVSPTVNLQLEQMRSALEAQGFNPNEFQITETGVNTTVQHASGAANLDMSCKGVCTESQVRAAINTWPGSVKYETNSQADYNAKLSAGVPASSMLLLTGTFNGGVCSAGAGKCITAPHMSLKP